MLPDQYHAGDRQYNFTKEGFYFYFYFLEKATKNRLKKERDVLISQFLKDCNNVSSWKQAGPCHDSV